MTMKAETNGQAGKALRTWDTVPLSQICDAVRGVTFSSSDAASQPFDGSVACLTTSGVQQGVAWESRRFIPRSNVSTVQMLRAGDILVSTANSKELVGKSCLVGEPPFDCAFGAFVTVLRPKPTAHPQYLAAWLRTKEVMDACYSLSSNTTGISNLRVNDLLDLTIALPSLDEQRRIAAVLHEQMAAVERARAAAEQQLGAARTLPASYLRTVFGNEQPLATKRLDNPPPGFRWVKLNDIARLESGHTPSRLHPEWWGGDIPWLALPDIRAVDGLTVQHTSEYTNEDGIAHSAARVLPAGTVCLSRTASVGFVTILGRPMATSQDFVNWVCGPDLDPRFLAYVLRASRRRILELASGAVHKTVYMPTVESFHVCIPAVSQQLVIANELDATLGSAANVERAMRDGADTIRALEPSLLRAAFNGEL